MKKITYSLTIIMMITPLPSCKSYSRDYTEKNRGNKNDIYQILYYASLAGSSHNSQPWRAEVYGKDSILIFADKSRQLTVVDASSRELYISVGAFIENLNLAATCLGYESEIKIIDQAIDINGRVATIILAKSGADKRISSLKDIELRTTLRVPFDTTEIKESDLQKLISDESGNILFLSADSENGRYVKQKELESYSEQSKRKDAQDELVSWIRFSNKDAREKRDGLTTAGMGINGIGGFLVRNFFKPEDSKKDSFVNQGIDKTRLQVENCGGWIIITSDDENIRGWINTGRLYERTNLRCRNLNIGFHPMNQITEENDYEKSANKLLGFKGRIMFIARIGYVNNYPAPVSVRRPVEAFTTFK